MPQNDHALLLQIQLNLMSNGVAATKSQILRTALRALIALPPKERLQLLESLSPVKQGRPPKNGS